MAEELDQLTLSRARRGDPSALTALVERYQRPVFAVVGRIMAGRGPQSVEDLAQEVFLRVVRGIHRFDPGGPARLSTWILTVATRVCLNTLRGRPLDRPLDVAPPSGPDPEPEPPHHTASPEQVVVHRDLGRRVEAAMAALPEDMRAVLVLRAYHDMDYDEIAEVLGLEVGTVKSRLGRARAALRAALPAVEREA